MLGRPLLEKSLSLLHYWNSFFNRQVGSKAPVAMNMISGDGYEGKGFHLVPKEHNYTLIFLHGLGDTAQGWTDFVMMLRRRQHVVFSQTKFILPTAPNRPISINLGMSMPGWADIHGLTSDSIEDFEGYHESKKRLTHIIEGEIKRGIAPHHIILGGFSQGGATAYLTGLTYPRKLGGLIGLSAWCPFLLKNSEVYQNLQQDLRILHCHGNSDEIVQYKWGKMTVDELGKRAMKNIEFKTYPGLGHWTCNEELDAAADFIAKVFSDRTCDPTTSASTTE